MIQGTKKIDEFVKHATSMHALNACTFIGCIVFFIYLIWQSSNQAYPMMLPLMYAGVVLFASFVLKLSMQSSKILRAEVTDAEYDVLVLALNLVSLYLMLETIHSFSGMSVVVGLLQSFLPGYLFVLLTPLFLKDKSADVKQGVTISFFHFLKWTLGVSLAFVIGKMIYSLFTHASYLPMLSNAVVAASPLLVSFLSDRYKAQLRSKFIDEMYKDPLTEIANRKCYHDHYDSWRDKINRTPDMGVFVIFADIDFFKQYNDHYGHEDGDSCLFKVANELQRLAHTLSENYSVKVNAYRYGGEEFVLAGKMKKSDVHAIASSPEIKSWESGNWLLDHAHHATPSGKVTLSAGANWLSADEVYRTNAAGATAAADVLLYDVKRNGRARLKFADDMVGDVKKMVV